MTPEMFGGKDYNGVTIQVLGDDAEAFASLGHVEPERMAVAASKAHREVNGDDGDQPFMSSDVEHRWAVLQPSRPGAADDEWAISYPSTNEPTTPGAFALTVVTA